MSILLSTYWEEGIVFSADRNATIEYLNGGQDVEVGAATKVIAWPGKKAMVGFIGLGRLADLNMDEWMRQFIARTWEHEDIRIVARELQRSLQSHFHADYPAGTDVSRKGMIAHLGGFRYHNDVPVPTMYVISNISTLLTAAQPYPYPPATRDFDCVDLIEETIPTWGVKYPDGVRSKIGQIVARGDFFWFNHGIQYPIFNRFKAALWQVLEGLRAAGLLPAAPSIEDRAAFSEMAVRLFGLFYEQYSPPRERFVGGGADTEWISWPA